MMAKVNSGEEVVLDAKDVDSFVQLRLGIPPDAPKNAGGQIVVEIVHATTGVKYTEVYQNIYLDRWARENGNGVLEDLIIPVPRNHRAQIIRSVGHCVVRKFAYLPAAPAENGPSDAKANPVRKRARKKSATKPSK